MNVLEPTETNIKSSHMGSYRLLSTKLLYSLGSLGTDLLFLLWLYGFRNQLSEDMRTLQTILKKSLKYHSIQPF